MAGPLDTLAQRFDVIVPDHPGFGGSEALAWIDDISDLAYCYLDVIEALGLSGVHIVGQSLGGWIALKMAVRSTQCLLPRRPRDHHAGIQFASQSVRMTKVKTKIATPKMMSCPRINFGRSAALILIIAPPEHIEM